jgi:hypothetical protein
MRISSFRVGVGGSFLAGVIAIFCVNEIPLAGQGPSKYKAPRSPYRDGKPDLNGVYQAINTANWDLEDHPMAPGAFWQLGALGGVPPGQGVVEGGTIPYQPWAVERKKFNYRNRLIADVYKAEFGDPEVKCYLPGVPRANYMPYPFQIVQAGASIMMTYTFANANRIVNMTGHRGSSVDSWMGWSNGRWEGDTLVVEVEGFNDPVWLDRAGNFASGRLKVTERFTRTGPDHLQYEATLEDPAVYTRPWKISMPLYRLVNQNAQLVEYRCVELTEEALYGHLTKKPKPPVPVEMTPSGESPPQAPPAGR